MSSGLKRHVGRLKNTDRRVVVVYMQLPGKPDSALIIDTDALPDQFHEFLMAVVDSDAGQNTKDLAEVLDRRASPDAGMNLMNSMHRRGLMRPEPIDNIVMFPRPNMPFPLAKIIEMNNAGQSSVAEKALEEYDPSFSQHAHNFAVDTADKDISLAKGLLIDASLLEEEVIKKRNKAYNLAPSLRPGAEAFATPKVVQPVEFQDAIARAQEHLDRSVQREEFAAESALITPPVPVALAETHTKPKATKRTPASTRVKRKA
jgi:hypothetical protein